VLALALHDAGVLGGAGLDDLFNSWVYLGIEVLVCALVLTRAFAAPADRGAWLALGIGVAFYTAGDLYYTLFLENAASVPSPSPADAGYLLFYPLVYASLARLVGAHARDVHANVWLDGAIGGLTLAAVGSALVLEPVIRSTHGTLASVATNLAYPIGDLTLLALVATAAALDGWRLGARWLVLGAGLVVLAVSDVTYLLQSADGTYVEGGLLDAAWPLGALLIAAAAWIAPSRGAVATAGSGLRQILIPTTGALVAIGVQAAARFTYVPPVAAVLSLVTLCAVVVRMALSFRENQANLDATTHQALTDPLTGLGNRRRLMAELDEATARERQPGEVCLMVVFDLDGFKAYNDAYGHPAGDALLGRLGDRLAVFIAGRGGAYRLGGDEFCLLAECSVAQVDGLVAGATASLGERGDGFVVTASQGSVLIPVEAHTRETALQLADRRMYANKSRERASAGAQSTDVLLTALREREPDLHQHLTGVAALAIAVSDELGVGAEERDEIRRAAELHDVGKMAIPDAILSKPGPLDPAEWEFMRKHTLIAERIIAAAPALVPIARLVRSSHERWDGDGYPDGLAGEAIPRGSRIVFCCDAYDAMISERPYSVAMLGPRALEEIDRNAGSQFDPRVAAALRKVLQGQGRAQTAFTSV
jgi:two-component system, cell cycle response regulator